jgi:20S proteasome alpha/beta subunit
MTIAAGFFYADGVLVCADSQFTVGASKIDGLKVGHFDASWGQVVCSFAGNVDYAAAAFQACERECEEPKTKTDPRAAFEEILSSFYERHVFAHPKSGRDDTGYSLFLGIRLNHGKAKLYRTQETVLRELRAFDCAGSGEDSVRDLLRFLYRGGMSRTSAVALASYTLSHAKNHIQYCGGPTVIRALDNHGNIDEVSAGKLEDLAVHMERVGCWFVSEAQKFMLGHWLGDDEVFKKRLEILNQRALRMRAAWESMPSIRSGPQLTTLDQIDPQPWPELLGEPDEF